MSLSGSSLYLSTCLTSECKFLHNSWDYVITIPIQVSHTAHAYKKECLTTEKNGTFSSELRAADLSVLHWDLFALPLCLSIMEQTSRGSYMRTLRRSYSGFFTLCRVPRRPLQLPDTGDMQISPGGAHDPTPHVQSQESLPEGAAICAAAPSLAFIHHFRF